METVKKTYLGPIIILGLPRLYYQDKTNFPKTTTGFAQRTFKKENASRQLGTNLAI